MAKKIIQWSVRVLSVLVLFVGVSSIKLPSVAFFYQPVAPKALHRDNY